MPQTFDSQPTILIIDDDLTNLAVITDYLDACNFAVLVADSGLRGVEIARDANPDLIILDIMMPEIDGLETCRRLKAIDETKDIPIIFLTALDEARQKLAGFRAGAVDYITKPFQQEEVLARIATQLHIRTLHRQLKQANAALEHRVMQRTAELARTNRELHQEIAERKLIEAQLREARDQLEFKVRDRTIDLEAKNRQLEREIRERERIQAERDEMHKRLYQTARLAGMAEVSAAVLHNVGNAMNSIQVTTDVLTDQLLHSRAKQTAEVSAILKQHASDLVKFLTTDSRGNLLLEYLCEVGDSLTAEHQMQLNELQRLRKTVDYMDSILHRQHAYAGTGYTAEVVCPQELVNDALLIVEADFARCNIDIRRQDAAVPQITVEKHKVIQILVNLLKNAEHAVRPQERDPRVVTIRLDQPDPDYIRICVIDNGMGIQPHNLPKLFRYGFTTKRNGLGLGLHSSFLTAKEIGGKLSATSSGVGRGAEFMLILPKQPPVASSARESEPEVFGLDLIQSQEMNS